MKRVLITGASGFLGAHLVCGLRALGFKVFAHGGRREPAAEVVGTSEQYFSGDLAQSKVVSALLGQIKPEFIVHCAALGSANVCQSEPERARQSNVVATKNLIECFRGLGVFEKRRFFYISTDLVFDGGEAPVGGFSEEDEPRPRSVYACSKREGEQVVLASSLSHLVLRTCLIYGSKIGQLEGFLGWMHEALAASKPLKLFFDEWRTPIFIEDIIRIVAMLLQRQPRKRVYNLAGPERLSRYEFGEILADVYGYDPLLLIKASQSEYPAPVPRPRDVSLSTKRLTDEFPVKLTRPREALLYLRQGLT